MLSKRELFEIVFKTDSKAGKTFNLVLLWTIIVNVVVVVFDSIESVSHDYRRVFDVVEWSFTILFSLEYLVRIYISPQPKRYIFSAWGIIDLVAILPTYLSLLLTGTYFFSTLRLIRLLRIFRILKLTRFIFESRMLFRALQLSIYKIVIFMLFMLILVIMLGSFMYVIEGEQSGFSSIPQSIYWAIITITTVGYGDIVPVTVVGKFIASFMMLIGYSIIAVPTGIISFQMFKTQSEDTDRCSVCFHENPKGSLYCNQCGNKQEQV